MKRPADYYISDRPSELNVCNDGILKFMTLTKVPIIDKNGRHTHVWRQKDVSLSTAKFSRLDAKTQGYLPTADRNEVAGLVSGNEEGEDYSLNGFCYAFSGRTVDGLTAAGVEASLLTFYGAGIYLSSSDALQYHVDISKMGGEDIAMFEGNEAKFVAEKAMAVDDSLPSVDLLSDETVKVVVAG